MSPVLGALSESEQEVFAGLLHKMLAALPGNTVEMYTICRLCDERACEDCPLPGPGD